MAGPQWIAKYEIFFKFYANFKLHKLFILLLLLLKNPTCFNLNLISLDVHTYKSIYIYIWAHLYILNGSTPKSNELNLFN